MGDPPVGEVIGRSVVAVEDQEDQHLEQRDGNWKSNHYSPVKVRLVHFVRLLWEAYSEETGNKDPKGDLELHKHGGSAPYLGGRDLVDVERDEEGEGSSCVAIDEAATEEGRHVEEAREERPANGKQIKYKYAS